MSMHPDLEWLARNVSEWPIDHELDCGPYTHAFVSNGKAIFGYGRYGDVWHSEVQWLQARKDLGLIMTDEEEEMPAEESSASRSDGSTASYYRLPEGSTELQHLISYRNMNSQIGEIFRACYRFGLASHSDQLRDAKKILFYAQAEVERLEAPRARELEK